MQEKDQLLMDTLQSIATHRAEKGKQAAIKYEFIFFNSIFELLVCHYFLMWANFFMSQIKQFSILPQFLTKLPLFVTKCNVGNLTLFSCN